ncbi:hypothetical protein [Arenimonas daejeonensis]|uniref:hypothetical protein n=1 Tax=Arenimonas daejeonensis TaxID=370777 RepID=UPI003CCE3B3C
MIDTLLANMDRQRVPDFVSDLGLRPGGSFVSTLHRPANADDGEEFARLLPSIVDGTRSLPLVFPVPPVPPSPCTRYRAPSPTHCWSIRSSTWSSTGW